VISGKRRLWNCKACHKQFTAKVHTIFEDSPLGLDKWLPAMWMLVNAKNGISSCELARSIGVSQKTAWHMGHRIHAAMHDGVFNLAGEVEADETFIGGKARNMHREKWKKFKETNRAHMTAVAGLLERTAGDKHSRVKLSIVKTTRRGELQDNVRAHVGKGASVFTDALLSYEGLNDKYLHQVIDHAVAYADGAIHTNGLENFWSLLKRSLKGTYVHVGVFHLFRYLDEQATRINERGASDLGRFLNTLRRVSGRKLTYKKLTEKETPPAPEQQGKLI
jgi:hypothetical protein